MCHSGKKGALHTTPRPPKVPDSGSSNVASERTTSHVCRIQFQPPAVGDLFYLRLSVASQGVCVLVPSLHALRTVSSAAGFFETEHETFQHAARRALGLVAGDGEYFIFMEEASVYKIVGKQLRCGIFVT